MMASGLGVSIFSKYKQCIQKFPYCRYLATFAAITTSLKTTSAIDLPGTRESDKNSFPIMESFYTIQGEGYHTGTPSYFIRIGGCDVGCHWCDVKESWPMEGHNYKSADDLLSETKQFESKTVVVTGGEPLMYDMFALTQKLSANGYRLMLETSGAYPLSGNWHWICLSPKKFKQPVPGIHQTANELKVVVYNKSDFDWAEEHAAKVSKDCKLYLQPEWSKKEKIMPEMVEYVKQHPKWKISLQTHKYLGIP